MGPDFGATPMKVFSVVIQIEDDGSTALCDMIEYEG